MELRVRDIPISYEERGTGRPIVVLHGRPSSRVYSITQYEPVLSRRDGWHRFYPDLPGMGDTPGADSIATHDDYLAVMLEFVDRVTRGRPFALVGISWGSVVARGIVNERLDRIIGLHLCVPRVDFGPSPAPPHTVFVSDADAIAAVAADERPWLDVAVVQTPHTLASFRSAVKPGLEKADMGFLMGLAEHGGFSFELDATPALPAPALIIAGRQDSMVGYRRAIEILEQYPRATLAVLDRAGHALDVEQNELFAALVGEWLDRVEEWPPRER